MVEATAKSYRGWFICQPICYNDGGKRGVGRHRMGRMRQQVQTIIPALIEKHHQHLLGEWLACQKRAGASSGGQASDAALTEQSRRFLTELRQGAAAGYFDDLSGPEWDSTRALLEAVGNERAVQGFSPAETALFVLSLKQPLFELLQQELGDDAPALVRETWTASLLID